MLTALYNKCFVQSDCILMLSTVDSKFYVKPDDNTYSGRMLAKHAQCYGHSSTPNIKYAHKTVNYIS